MYRKIINKENQILLELSWRMQKKELKQLFQ